SLPDHSAGGGRLGLPRPLLADCACNATPPAREAPTTVVTPVPTCDRNDRRANRDPLICASLSLTYMLPGLRKAASYDLRVLAAPGSTTRHRIVAGITRSTWFYRRSSHDHGVRPDLTLH